MQVFLCEFSKVAQVDCTSLLEIKEALRAACCCLLTVAKILLRCFVPLVNCESQRVTCVVQTIYTLI